MELLRVQRPLLEDYLGLQPRLLQHLRLEGYSGQLHLKPLKLEHCLDQQPQHLSLRQVDFLVQVLRSQLNLVAASSVTSTQIRTSQQPLSCKHILCSVTTHLTNVSSGGLGTQNQQSQPQQSSMFSSSQNQPQAQSSFLGGGLSLGQTNNQNQQTVPGVRIDLTNLRGTTRFNDLHEDLQKEISKLDDIIQGQIKLASMTLKWEKDQRW